MITGDELLALLDENQKSPRDLFRYVCDGLQPYGLDDRPVDFISHKVKLRRLKLERMLNEIIEEPQYVPDQSELGEISPHIKTPKVYIERQLREIDFAKDILSEGGRLGMDEILAVFPASEIADMMTGLISSYYIWEDVLDHIERESSTSHRRWITGKKLLALLDQADKTDRDLIRYVCNGLQTHDINQRPVYPARLLLVIWQEEAARIAKMHLLFEEEAARLDVPVFELMTEYLTHRRVMRDMSADDAERYHRKLLAGVFKEPLARDVTIKQLIETLPDGENRRIAQSKVEAASVLEMLNRETFESVHSRLNTLIELVSGGEPIPLQWFLGVFSNTAIDSLAAELMGGYFERRDVQRFIDADAQEPPMPSEPKTTEEHARPEARTPNGSIWTCDGSTSWGRVSILIVNLDMAEITVDGNRFNVEREALGFTGYGDEPSVLWEIFRAFASHGGVLKPDYLPTEISSRKNIKNDISAIRKKLRSIFTNIPEDKNPITYDATARLYRAQFELAKKADTE